MKNGGFLKDRAGAIVIAAMNADSMRRIADHGAGVYAVLSADDVDIDTLTDLIETSADEREALLSDRSAAQWRELGPSLILLVLPFAALAFRRGLIWTLPLAIMLLPPDVKALDWQELWSNSDQRALQLFEQGEHAAAARMFGNGDWRASANYRAGDFAAAAENWQRLDSEDAGYNHGNALAQQGRYEEALAAYDHMLQQNPTHADAIYNRQAIADWLQQQQQSPQQNQSSEQSDGAQQSQQASGDGSQAQNDGDQAGAGDDRGEAGEQTDQSQAESQMQDNLAPDKQDGQQGEQSTQVQKQPGDQDSADADADADAAMANLDKQMSEQAAQQWLRKIPDDPGGLLRRKFVYQYRHRGGVDMEEQTW
jgi:Ca-activated chloride channel family protein